MRAPGAEGAEGVASVTTTMETGEELQEYERLDARAVLEALVQKPGSADGWNGPYLKSGVPQDPWKNDYHYAFPGSRAELDIYSLGQDGSEGGDGEDSDVGNW